MRRALWGAWLLAAAAQAADPALVYVGTWPKTLAVMDEASGRVIDRIALQTDVARTLLPTADRKRLVVITVKDAGIETIDLATRKVVDSFTLGSASKRIRIQGAVLDPAGKLLYLTMTAANRLIDRFEIEAPQFAVVDLAARKVVKTVALPKQVAPDSESGGRRGGGLRISPDGKFLWFFRENIYIVDTTDFQVVETIPLEKPDSFDMTGISLNGQDDPNEAPGKMTALFSSTDPVVHRRIFGVAEIDLTTRKIQFSPIGPGVAGGDGSLRLSPDRKFAYGFTVEGEQGDRHCEFFVIDMVAKKVVNRGAFPGRTRFSTGLTSDGKYIIVYGAGHTMELYDVKTLRLVKDIDMDADMTTPLLAIVSR
jgi:DNA-binding beta-propeller fold protein YncE